MLWLFDKVMFTSNHVNTVDARYIGVAREIAEARCREDIVQKSWSSAVLAATLRAMCCAYTRHATNSAILCCLCSCGRLSDSQSGARRWTFIHHTTKASTTEISLTLLLLGPCGHEERYNMLVSRSRTATQHSLLSSTPCILARSYGSRTPKKRCWHEHPEGFPSCVPETNTTG